MTEDYAPPGARGHRGARDPRRGRGAAAPRARFVARGAAEAGPRGSDGLGPINDDLGLEREADEMGAMAARGATATARAWAGRARARRRDGPRRGGRAVERAQRRRVAPWPVDAWVASRASGAREALSPSTKGALAARASPGRVSVATEAHAVTRKRLIEDPDPMVAGDAAANVAGSASTEVDLAGWTGKHKHSGPSDACLVHLDSVLDSVDRHAKHGRVKSVRWVAPTASTALWARTASRRSATLPPRLARPRAVPTAC
jgi:hypothetical protein